MSCCCCPTTLLIIAGVLFFLYKKFGKKEIKLRETNWKKDVVYLYQFPPVKHVRNLSPFCMKIEILLRTNKIEYEVRETMWERSQYGLLPFIELNGVQYADSKIIELALIAHFNIKPVASEEKEALGLLASRTIDAHTFYILAWYKIVSDPSIMFNEIGSSIFPECLIPILTPILTPLMKYKVSKRVAAGLGGRHSDSDMKLLLKNDLEALSIALGDNKYFGGDKISLHDCSIFGHLASVYYPFETYCKHAIDNFPKLVTYLENVRKEVYPNDFTL